MLTRAITANAMARAPAHRATVWPVDTFNVRSEPVRAWILSVAQDIPGMLTANAMTVPAAAIRAEGVQTAVFSNKADAFCGKLIEHYFGPDSFSLVRGSRPGVPTKPDPAGVYSLMADLGADPQSTLFVGDSDVDILTGHNAGLPALGVLWGFRGEAELTAAGADALAAKPEDILTYLHQH